MSLISNIQVYLKNEYNLGGVFVVNVFNIWSGSSNFTGVAGAFLADAYLGKFLTLLFGSMASFLVKFYHYDHITCFNLIAY